MKIQNLTIGTIDHRPLLNGLDIQFYENNISKLKINTLIGINGSGKSQVLETIADIFLWVDCFYRTENIETTYKNAILPFTFEILYSIEISKKNYSVKISNDKVTKKVPIPLVEVYDEKDNVIVVNHESIKNYLPEKVVGYSSGENETISTPFYLYYDDYAEYTGKRANPENVELVDYEPKFYFMNYSTNLGIAISNLIFDDVDGINEIKDTLNIKRIKSFQLIIQTKQTGAPSGEVKLTTELIECRNFLFKSATCYSYDQTNESYILDFYNNKATIEALKYFFKTSYSFYTAIYKLELLNNLMISKNVREDIKRKRKKRKLETKMPTVPDRDKVLHYSELKLELNNNQIVDYLSLSDGEHQFMNIFGTILMVNQDNSLFLLDEPETHFNPQWRRLFIHHLNNIAGLRSQEIFITSHSPFIVSDSKRESVYIFKRESRDIISVNPPRQETFGASFDHILKMAFNLDDTLSKDASDLIKELRNEDNPQTIEDKLNELGDSPLLMALYSRIDMLKNRSK
ncbi:MAG: restriction system-associated AAA family ATPase [Paludibacter sp.]|nr:restriction system-associated AAA family ATPase [Paludibacter sp.]